MAETLLIRFGADPAAEVDYAVVAEDGRLLSPPQRAALGALGAQAAGRRVVVLVPGADVLLTEAAVPTRNRARLRRAVPYALEEQIAADVETQHFALGPVSGDRVQVAVVARSRMEAWRDALAAAGLEAARMVPETQAVPVKGDDWGLLLDGERVLLSGPLGEGYACELETLPGLLSLLLPEPDARLPVRVFKVGREQGPELPERLDIRGLQEGSHALEFLAAGLVASRQAIDLLQGDFSRRAQYGRLWRRWRFAAALLVAAVLAAGARQVMTVRQLEAERLALQEALEQAYLQTFPSARRVVKPVVQMKQKLAELRRQQGGGQSTGFLDLLARAGEVLRRNPEVRILILAYRDGHLDLEINAPSLQVIDGLKQALAEQAGLVVEIQSASSGEGEKGVEGRLRIKGVKS